MVGTHIVSTLLANPSISHIVTLSRRPPRAASTAPQTKLTAFISDDTSLWAPHLASVSPPPAIFISSFGTTRASAGGFDNQYKVEHGLNIEMAKAAKEMGVKAYVLVSSAGASKTSSFPYSRMKGEIEEDVRALNFDRTIILRPGIISGTRGESRPAEAVLRFFAGIAGKVHSTLKDSWAQDADVIARAAVNAGLKTVDGEVPAGSEKVWILNGDQIIRLGKL